MSCSNLSSSHTAYPVQPAPELERGETTGPRGRGAGNGIALLSLRGVKELDQRARPKGEGQAMQLGKETEL